MTVGSPKKSLKGLTFQYQIKYTFLLVATLQKKCATGIDVTTGLATRLNGHYVCHDFLLLQHNNIIYIYCIII